MMTLLTVAFHALTLGVGAALLVRSVWGVTWREVRAGLEVVCGVLLILGAITMFAALFMPQSR